ncbi:putative geranyltranstransferase [Megalodesulfovibrio gigas DSM 1382 = ATCC 19364]|uniref:Putative geranyltranstransferase n=2 Tax=Megalodesulfovibrio gigas TaxID=879 RepID=T2GD64_MEGG1|nr:putative geranyltranstransferase [Megalodesulfovibrio gigas DSM 1382 = ATCC 19364]
MSAEAMKQLLAERAALVETALRTCLHDADIPAPLLQAMEYSLHAGGKRLRPVLCLTAASLFGLDAAVVMPFACGIECIHTYSLIHDDLPAMDNDDLRRGKPTNHKVFGEAMAILAGDGLLTEAFRRMAGVQGVAPGRVLQAVAAMAAAAGAAGMVGGQALDMGYEKRTDITLPMLRDMHARKTGALIQASCLCGALLAGADEADQARLAGYGAALGVAFQIADDILDEVGDTAVMGKAAGSDRERGKTTYVSLVGLEKSRELACQAADEAAAQLHSWQGRDAAFLTALCRYVVDRAC